MLGRTFLVSQNIDDVAAAQTLGILTMPADRVGLLRRVSVTNRDQSTAEQLEVILARVTALGTPTVSYDNDGGGNNNVTVGQADPGDAATGATVRFDVTGNEPTLAQALDAQGVQNMAGYYWEAQSLSPVVIPPSGSIAVKLNAAPGNTTSFTVALEWDEIGT